MGENLWVVTLYQTQLEFRAHAMVRNEISHSSAVGVPSVIGNYDFFFFGGSSLK